MNPKKGSHADHSVSTDAGLHSALRGERVHDPGGHNVEPVKGTAARPSTCSLLTGRRAGLVTAMSVMG
jgi:hypothetical protein